MKKISRREMALAAVPMASSLAVAGCGRQRRPARTEGELEYNIDHLLAVDPALVRYREEGSIPVAARQLRAVTVGSRGELFVAADEAVLIRDSAGRWARLELAAAPVAVVELAPDQVLVAMAEHLELWQLEGSRLSVWPTLGEASLITAVAVHDDTVVVADAGRKLVQRLSLEGRTLGEFAGRDNACGVEGLIIPSPSCDLAVGPDGFLWIVNPGRHQIENYAPDGQLRSAWGRPGMDIEGFCGCCNPTHLAVLADGAFVTAEKGLPRVKVYEPDGRLRAVVAPPAAFAAQVVGLDLAVAADGSILVLDPAARSIRRFVEIG